MEKKKGRKGMITFILMLSLFIVLLACLLCFHLVGGALRLVLRLVIGLPCALVVGTLGLVFCCTLVLIPLGLFCFHLAGALFNPFRLGAI